MNQHRLRGSWFKEIQASEADYRLKIKSKITLIPTGVLLILTEMKCDIAISRSNELPALFVNST